MSYIFRSDNVAPGERVVARRQYTTVGEDGRPHTVYSDVIGHVLSTSPLVIRPQEVGGYPSAREAVEIAPEELKIIKRLSPRTVRNSDIRAIEVATAAAFPGTEHTWTSDGQWLMRAGDGITGRSNSAVPLGPSAGFSPVPMEEIEAFYARHGLPVCLEIPERIGKPAEKLVAAAPQAWELEPEILVMARDLPAEVTPQAQEGISFRIDEQPDRAWLDLYHFRGQALPEKALFYLRSAIEGRMGFGRLLSADGETVAITRGTLTESGDGSVWLGYSAVEVAEPWRRRGLGTLLGAHMLRWGAEHGAQRAYLQVVASNAAGIRLYEKLGFIEHHRHRYARRLVR
ncbi:GNAT family N-acetyltransferase [Corynebacterium sp.]|uniref:N-acetylglutamate synthase, CG3035 family n=1 Tax=Corynebacterium sp. TaxID=1720 RepID=UPI0026DBBC1C|nr:GNAT family N-acetyltransferase [Corynebacterium sp.]MDO5032299.1 GNAT family N-acetyltransferase [Corynebacterium sp.]